MYKYFSVAIIVLLIDQLTKWSILKYLEIGERIVIWDPWFAILSHRNRGAAWGMLEGQMWIFFIVTIVVIIGILYFYFKEAKDKPLYQICLMLLLGGALGNFIDRLFRGEVVDFIDVLIPIIHYEFPIFNIADSALTIAVIMLIIAIIREDKKEKVNK